MNVESLVQAQRKNFEAIAAANQLALEGYQAVAKRQADIVRESIDGATMYALQAGAEGWPATEWLQPWTPADANASA